MKPEKTSSINTFLELDYSKNNNNSIWLTNSLTLRKSIGILGMGLPFLLFLFLFIETGLSEPLESISHYYYTRVASIFVAILSILATFLIIYKGKEPVDFYISLIAGLFALCVVCFPTSNITEICCDASKKYSVTILKVSAFRKGFHYASAGIFLGCLAYMSLFLFTKSDKSPQQRGSKKIIRNRIYSVCGFLMIGAILVIGAGFFELISKTFYDDHQLTFWMETVAVESFGFSWLIKGETLFKD